MSTIHFLNVGHGDCSIIQHNSGRVSMIDICKGNYVPSLALTELQKLDEMVRRATGNFGMSKKPTNPLRYLESLGIEDIFRFILTHPDMDHLDGFDALMDTFKIWNFWDSGIRRGKPEFENQYRYDENDWDRYEAVVNGEDEELKGARREAGTSFHYANKKGEDGSVDGLHILGPDPEIARGGEDVLDVNDSSYVILYRSPGGRIVIPGDAHDETWEYVINNYGDDVKNCDVLFAPHHGRKSGRSFDFLDVLNPRITLFGCANSGDLAYGSWSSRELPVITNNQAGNIVIESTAAGLDVYCENHSYARAQGCDTAVQNGQGYPYLGRVRRETPISAGVAA